MNAAVFLDRDGVINQVTVRNGIPHPPRSVEEVIIPADAKASLMQLKKAGYLLIVVTNQPDVSRSKTTRATVEAINRYLCEQLPIDAVYVCYHDDQDDCDCRKPKPGLLTSAAKIHHIDLTHSFIIGDRWRDIEAGKNALCKTIFLDAHYSESIDHPVSADYSVVSLEKATECILQNEE